jgi:hypothetical protein
MARRAIFVVAALLAAAAQGVGGPTPAAGAGRTIVFGSAVEPRTAGQTRLAAIQQLETTIGRPLAAVRNYYVWNAPFPTSEDRALRDSGHTI